MSDIKFCQDNCERDAYGQIWHSNQCNFYRSTKAFEFYLELLVLIEKLQADLALAIEGLECIRSTTKKEWLENPMYWAEMAHLKADNILAQLDKKEKNNE